MSGAPLFFGWLTGKDSSEWTESRTQGVAVAVAEPVARACRALRGSDFICAGGAEVLPACSSR